MRPYLAVIQDAFREAIASRVLWILLVLIALFLLAIAPFGFHQQLTTSFGNEDVVDWPKLVEALKDGAGAGDSTAAGYIWSEIGVEAQQAANDFTPLSPRPTFSEAQQFERSAQRLTRALRSLIDREDLHEAAIWQETIIGEEATNLLNRAEELDSERRKRLNRLLVEAAFPGVIRRSRPTSLQLTYATMEVGPPIRTSSDQLAANLRTALPWLIDKGLLSIGLLVAILVTASIIPQTFEPGSLHLLLSKPVSRWMLFLSKFVGGCAFVLLCITFLFVGLWLVLGLRLNIWEHGLLLSIPLYVFVFAIYYSVSAAAGVIWRNAIVSIVIAMLFWLICFTVGVAKGQLEGFLDRFRITRCLRAGDDIICANRAEMVFQWDGKDQQWQDTMVSEEREMMGPAMMFVPGLSPMSGPVYDASGDRLLMGQFSFESGQPRLYIGTRQQSDPDEPQWKVTAGPILPPANLDLFAGPDQQVLAASQLGLFRLQGDPTRPAPTFFGFTLPLPGAQGFQEVDLNPPLLLDMPADTAIDARTGELAVYSSGTITVLAPVAGGNFERRRRARLRDAEGEPALVAIGGQYVALARGNGQLLLLDKDGLQVQARFRPEGDESPRSLVASPDGNWFALLFHNSRLWLLDAKRLHVLLANVTGQEDISAVALPDEQHVLVADRFTRVIQYKTASQEVVEQHAPPLGFFERSYLYVIVPLYALFPKPGEMYKTVQYVLTEKETSARGEDAQDLSAARERLRPWAPVWSSLGFIAIVLVLTCIYIERQDF